MEQAQKSKLPGFFLEAVLPGNDVLAADAIINYVGANTLPVDVVHGPFIPYDKIYSGEYGITGKLGFERLVLAAELAKALGAKWLVVHDDTYAKNTQPAQELEEMRRQLWPIAVDNLIALREIFPGTLLENLTRSPWSDTGNLEAINVLGTEGPLVARLAAEAGLRGIVDDISHGCSLGELPPEVARLLGAKSIRHLHLASYVIPYEEGVPLGRGIIAPQMLRELLDVLDYDITATIEVLEPRDIPMPYVALPNLRASVEWLQEFDLLAS
jgi:sugar phosphate isomerase/epimerase